MTRHILLPLDGSTTAEAVIPYAVSLARATGASLLLLRIVTPGEISQSLFWKTTIPAELRREWTEEVLARTNMYLASVAERLRSMSLRVSFDVQPADDAAAAIIARAEHEPGVGLIAMTTHGYGGALRWAFGSVAAKVLHAAPTPLLVVRSNGGARPPVAEVAYRTICVPLDGSLLAEQALAEAQLIAARTGAALVLISVVAHADDGAIEAREYLERIADQLRARQIDARARVAEGAPAEQIIRAAEAEEADLIVMATHGRTGLQHLWLGSIATKVVHDSALPVLLVRAQDEEALYQSPVTIRHGHPEQSEG
ncbi:universal stress protein [Roseiflexus sp.]|uniref:universal stress protein n=1 Tax=Roseiflexus sp. TaxID=2562120 RepID=UPI0021DCCF6B|nr:universal stress protein [Roseiflexus sp.]GIW00750.1 MAG: universal stress protein UspA [Roseiflexus sp.]